MPRVKVEYRSTSKAVYDKFCETHPHVKLTFEQWKSIIYTYNHMCRDYILETGERIKLPWGLGSFSIGKKKMKKYKIFKGQEVINLPIDWPKTRKAGKYIYHLNTHSDGYRYKWMWFSRDARIYHTAIWVFKPSRVSSRKLAEYIKKPNSVYSQIYKQWSNV